MTRKTKIGLVASGAFLLYILLGMPGTRDRIEQWSRGGDPSPTSSRIIQALGTGIAAFRDDWGQYPPSRFTDEPYDLEAHGGTGLLAYYLQGPQGNGWGGEWVQYAPFGGTASRPCPPYAPPDIKGILREDERPVGFLDAFQPPKPVLYFRAEPGRDPLFDVHDNPVDPTGRCGFASQEHFERLVRPAGPDGTRKWLREDYLLISPGLDRLYGHAVGGRAGSGQRPARPGEADALCDDVANFSY